MIYIRVVIKFNDAAVLGIFIVSSAAHVGVFLVFNVESCKCLRKRTWDGFQGHSKALFIFLLAFYCSKFTASQFCDLYLLYS